MSYPWAKIPKLKKTLEEVCRHEAGHHVVARCLGFKVGDITVMIINASGAHEAGAEVVLFHSLITKEEIVDYAERRVQVLYAGALAQTLSNSKVSYRDATIYLQGAMGMSDIAKARELIQLIRSIKHPEDKQDDEVQSHLSEIEKCLWTKTGKMVEKESETICNLAEKIESEIYFLGTKYKLSLADINSLPAITKRFIQ